MSTSSVQRLRSVSPVFLASELSLRFGWSSGQTAVYLSRWNDQGLVRSLGGRSKIYFNLVVSPDWASHLEQAIRMAMPSALEIGAQCLHDGGLVTQRAYTADLAVLSRTATYTIEHTRLHQRTRTWYKIMQGHIEQTDLRELPRLTPPAALAEALVSNNGLWCPDPDDVYLDELSDDQLHALALLIPRLNSLYGTNIVWNPSDDPEDAYMKAFVSRQEKLPEAIDDARKYQRKRLRR